MDVAIIALLAAALVYIVANLDAIVTELGWIASLVLVVILGGVIIAMSSGCTLHVPIVACDDDGDARPGSPEYDPTCAAFAPEVIVIGPPEVFAEPCERSGDLVDASCFGCERWIACVYLGEHHLDDAGAPARIKQPEICQRYWSDPPDYQSETCALCLAGLSCDAYARWDDAVESCGC